MRTEVRFLLAIVLMMGVLVGTNLLFPPAPPEEGTPGDTIPGAPVGEPGDTGAPVAQPPVAGERDSRQDAAPREGAESEPAAPEIPGQAQEDPGAGVVPTTPDTVTAQQEAEDRRITVEGPLYRYDFSTRGARLLSAELLEFESFTREGPVELIPEGADALGHRLVVGSDTLDLRNVPFEVEPAGGLRLLTGEGASELTFTYEHPTAPFVFRVVYTFQPDSYIARVDGQVQGLQDAVLFTDLGDGIAFNEQDRGQDLQAMAYVGNHLQEGITAWNVQDVEEDRVVRDGPFLWAAFKSKYFVFALLPGSDEREEVRLGGLIARDLEEEGRVAVTATHPIASDGSFAYRAFMGPQDFARLTAIGDDLEDVNPYGWRFFRPIIRPLVGIVMAALTFLHDTLGWGYGWVLILFGVMMRVVFFPVYQKAMKAQLRNMAVQPLLKEIQEKYKDQPEKLQKEMMKLYKEHGFNPLAGCLPMLLPWPVLITLFFVFQNTIELRGVEFLWLPDLSSPDPLYLLPIFLGLSMFGIQYVSYRSMDEPNPQMKMMMWIMPGVMVFIFLNFASGLNLYYATANIASLPQQIWIAQERKKARKHGPPKLSED
ncbi:MAG: membrane protein insertase YidC [Longimicrobiales bacterium]|nr:membrane protein insertase YidC [Longimicrobiales bacterium]